MLYALSYALKKKKKRQDVQYHNQKTHSLVLKLQKQIEVSLQEDIQRKILK